MSNNLRTVFSSVGTSQTATISSGQTTSGTISFGNSQLGGIIMPATFTGTAISFKVCDTSTGTFVALKDINGNAISFTVAASTAIGFAPGDFAAWRFIQIVSNASEGGTRSITLLPLMMK